MMNLLSLLRPQANNVPNFAYSPRSPPMLLFVRPAVLASVAIASCLSTACFAETPQTGSHTAPALITQKIDDTSLVELRGNVRRDLAPEQDLGAVEDSRPLRLFLVLKRSQQQQIELDNLIARQQQPTAAEYHKWLTPQQFGERFGLAEQDIQKVSAWLESEGMHIDSVMNNASIIVFSGTAGDVREAFHTQLHYFDVAGGKRPALVTDPMIPAALANIVVGIEGLNKIPRQNRHTPIRQVAYDEATHRWHNVDPGASPTPLYNAGGGEYDETPHDFYTIYNVNKIYTAGYTGTGVTVAVPEPTDMHYGTVTAGTGVATGGDVATFRRVFGVAGTLDMHVYHGYGTVTCLDPGITSAGDSGEATLDAEWSNALAPAANLIFMSCDDTVDNGVDSSIAALIDNNLADAIGLSWGNSELVADASQYSTNDAVFTQAAAQGQTVFVAAGDAGSDTNDQDTTGTATSGLNIDAYSANPLITSAGGLDFQDNYDSQLGGPAQSKYWGATNSSYYADALSYVPETTWNGSCASSLLANFQNDTPAAYCATDPTGYVAGEVVGGGGGYSTHYAQPSWQSGILGLSAAATKRSTPDVALFASNGIWQHAIVDCDSDATTTDCSSTSTFGGAGGTSYVAPQMTGIAGLLVQYTGSRQGLWNPTLYALAKQQFTATATKSACYADGQTSNIGVTTSLPAAACIFNDVTTGNNDEPCEKGSLDCYVQSGATYGLLSTTGASSLNIGFNAGTGYDLASGIGSINVYNLFTGWDKAYTSTTKLAASLTTMTTAQSTTLTATVAGGRPADATGLAPTLAGTASFALGTTSLGSCTLKSGACSVAVAGTALKVGANSVTSTFAGSRIYPASTSSIVTITVNAASSPLTLTPSTIAFPNTVTGTTSDAQAITIKNTGTAAVSLTSIGFAGTSPTSFTQVNNCPASLAASATCSVFVAFKPASAAAVTANLTIANNAVDSPVTASLSGTGTAKPSVTLSATSLTFASTVEGKTSDEQSVTITNAGTSILDLTGIAIGGANASSFTQLNTCGATLAPSANCVVYVAFKPAAVGTLTGSLTITDTGNASPQTVTLTGTGAS